MPSVSFVLNEVNGELVSSPESQIVTEPNTSIVFTLAPAAVADFKLTGYTSNDQKKQLGAALINQEGTVMSFNDVNSQEEDINVTVSAEHRKKGTAHYIDPLVQNRPPN